VINRSETALRAAPKSVKTSFFPSPARGGGSGWGWGLCSMLLNGWVDRRP
jgi:hypothetical protein